MSEASEGGQRRQVQCVDHVARADRHTHISAVGLNNLGGGISTFTVEWVLEQMDKGDEFFTIGSHSKKEIDVEAYECSCGAERIRTKSDDEKDNNLDSLPRCSEWIPPTVAT
jgi:hypothetical protein